MVHVFDMYIFKIHGYTWCVLICVYMYACKLCALPAVLVRLLICLDNVSLYVSSYVRACTAANYPYLLPCLCVYLHIVLCPFPMCMCTCMCMCACMCMCMCMCPCPFSVAPFTPPCPIPLVCANLKASPSSPAPPPEWEELSHPIWPNWKPGPSRADIKLINALSSGWS